MAANQKTKVVFIEDGNAMYSERFVAASGNTLETKEGVYNLDEFQKFYNETEGVLYYFSNIDIQAKVEAQNLKMLRRSTALANLFKYEVKKTMSLAGLFPYAVIVLMILFG